jgi:hypothetical protein
MTVGVLTAPDRDAAFMVLNNLLRDPEAKSSAGGAFGCVEGIKEQPLRLRSHSRSGVGDGEPYS